MEQPFSLRDASKHRKMYQMKVSSSIFSIIASIVGVLQCSGVDWAEFRGPNGNPVHDGTLPLKWDSSGTENVAWKASLPGRGVSSPIVVDDLVVITASGGANQQKLFVVAIDQQTGKQRWRRSFWATGRTYTHPTSSNAAPTPVSDGQYIYAFYSSNDLACLDLSGNLMWYRGLAHDYPKAGNDVGMASSPAIAGDVVVVSHVSPIKSAVAWSVGAPTNIAHRMRLGQAAVSRIDTSGEGPVLVSFDEWAPE